MNTDAKKTRKDIIKLEKQMQRSPSAATVFNLAERYVDIGEPHQAVAILMEGIEAFPQFETLQVLCARFMIMYQTHDVSRAEELIKSVLIEHPDNVMAQQLLQQIHACVDTMHEVARPFGADLSELPTLKTQRVAIITPRQTEENREVSDEGVEISPFHSELTQAYGKLHQHDLDGALAIFQQILETAPDDNDAREGFRITYAAIVKETESRDRDKKIEVISRTIRLLESMKTVIHNDQRTD
ncbi:tetratricopeptide repeat protein [bacterium]|nr:tetratricopeptide repeat protein [candidate division CSSED10-310 bacterium]